jgi:hypothetical protein
VRGARFGGGMSSGLVSLSTLAWKLSHGPSLACCPVQCSLRSAPLSRKKVTPEYMQSMLQSEATHAKIRRFDLHFAIWVSICRDPHIHIRRTCVVLCAARRNVVGRQGGESLW